MDNYEIVSENFGQGKKPSPPLICLSKNLQNNNKSHFFPFTLFSLTFLTSVILFRLLWQSVPGEAQAVRHLNGVEANELRRHDGQRKVATNQRSEHFAGAQT